MKLTADATGTYIFAEGLSEPEYLRLREMQSWKWNRTKRRMEARITPDLVNALAEAGPLPEWLEEIRRAYQRRDIEMQKLRNEEHPTPVVTFPVRAKLYDHQTRGANMALCAFGIMRGGDATHAERKSRSGFGLLYE